MKRELSQGVSRCIWTPEEDAALRESALKHKGDSWNIIANEIKKVSESFSSFKTSKQCRERWNNQVNPSLRLTPLSENEIDKIFKFHEKFSSQWSKITAQLPGRTDNIIKNYFLCKLRRVVRYVKKGMSKSAKPRNERELLRIFYLMDYFYKFYVSPNRKENEIGRAHV